MNYYLTVLVTFLILSEGDNMPSEYTMYIQHKDPYNRGECQWIANNPNTAEILLSAVKEEFCSAFISIDEVGCMTREAYIQYNNIINKQ